MTAVGPQHPLALFDVDGLNDEADAAIRDTVRQIVDEEVRPGIAEWYETGSIPVRALSAELGASGSSACT